MKLTSVGETPSSAAIAFCGTSPSRCRAKAWRVRGGSSPMAVSARRTSSPASARCCGSAPGASTVPASSSGAACWRSREAPPLAVERQVAHDLAGEMQRAVDAAAPFQAGGLERRVLHHVLGEIGAAQHAPRDRQQPVAMMNEGAEHRIGAATSCRRPASICFLCPPGLQTLFPSGRLDKYHQA
ncbi:MAG: hypothetical protein U1E17_07615 [Geminicoccaceae bacterium]